MDEMGCERSEQRFYYENISLRRYGSFKCVVELHLELMISAEILRN